MSVWDSLIGQQAVVGQLQKAVATGSPNHAWLFTGPPGSGRSNVARAFAAALECENSEKAGCGTCTSCTTVLAGSHADVTLLSTDKVTIAIDEVRDLITRSYDRPSSGQWRIIIVEDADRMTERTSNVLLKALEEPAPHTVWMLCAPSPTDLLPTIRSRCQQISLKVPSYQEVAQLLQQRDGIAPDVAEQMARISQGHIGVAKWLAKNPEARERRAKILDIPFHMTSVGKAVRAAEYVVNLAKEQAEATTEEREERERQHLLHSLGAEEDKKLAPHVRAQIKRLEEDQKRRSTRTQKDSLDRIMIDLSAFYRDVLMCQLGVDIELMNVDITEKIKDFSAQTTPEATMKRLEAISKARSRLITNVSPLLTLEAMMLALR